MKRLLYILAFVSISSSLLAQKRALTHEDFDTWKRIRSEKISNNGEYIAYHLVPGKGDQTLKVKTSDGNEIISYRRGENSHFTHDSKYLVFVIKPALDSLNNLKRIKTKEKDLPKDSLAILNLENGSLTKIARVKSMRVPKKWSGYVFYQIEEAVEKKDTTSTDSTKTKNKKVKKVSEDNGFHLIARNLQEGTQDTIYYVKSFEIAEEGNKLLYSTSGKDSTLQEGVYYHDLENSVTTPLCRAKGKFKELALDKKGLQAAFLADLDTTKALIRDFQLRYWSPGSDSARVIANSNAEFLPDNWLINENGNLFFSDNSEALYFGTSPEPIVQDTTLLPEEIINVEIWNYKNGRLHTQQNAELEDDKKKFYRAVYYPESNGFAQLGTLEIPNVTLADQGNSAFSLGTSYLPYQQYISWEGYPRRMDLYLINNKTGESKKVKTDLRGNGNISSDGNFLFWINVEDTTYTSYDIASGNTFNLTEKIEESLVDELNDSPNYPSPYGYAGWSEGDKEFLIYDRYDIWSVDPKNQRNPIKLTNGRDDMTRYRYVSLDDEEESIDPKYLLLHLFNEDSRKEGYASLQLKNRKLNRLVFEDFNYSRPDKAKDSDQVLFTKENHGKFPDLLTSNLAFKKVTKISEANPQKSQYKWGSVEVYKWTSLDGLELEGLLYKPDNFDPNKKYPMMTYFYERNSDNLNRHWGAVPSRSIINPTFYASRGYVVFIPDIVYRTGYPGESCYNAVIPGVTSLIEKGFIDRDKIGVQGHSWGGYQVAYLVTKTNIFAAAESGAPVANMISAYGGIRWWTGLSRMFQYEHTQSRIGGTLWEYPIRFIENSPIFFVDKVETPLLIMHNDADGHVPWYQGIELYVAMRRLGKPAWMLNYNNEPHWPTKWENIRDFNIRMAQFFDHYLKEEPMPKWMNEGIPAIEKGIDKGYQFTEE